MMDATVNRKSEIKFAESNNESTTSKCGKGYNKGYNDNDNAIEMHEEEPDLTSLTWLTELRNQNLTLGNALTTEDDYRFSIQKHKSSSSPCKNIKNIQNKQTKSTSKLSISCNKNLNNQMETSPKRATAAERYKIFLEKIKRDLAEYNQSATSYQTDPANKPPFNYSHIIGMAMLENGRVTLQQICNWIEEKFAFFRTRKKWNNSIRHNLSLHYCFRKIDRNKFEKGKGGYWELGVDPKKCDRKRIRNRRTNRKKLENSDDLKLTNSVHMGQLSTPSTYPEQEEIDISVLEQPTNMELFPVPESVPLENVSVKVVFPQTIQENDIGCQQQYHLGTIIINAAEADVSSTSLSLLGNSNDWPLQYHNITNRENTNSPTLSNGNICLASSALNRSGIEGSQTTQNQDMLLRQFNVVSGSSLLRPNVIVEQVLEPQNSAFNTTENIVPLPINYVMENETFINSVNDNFRPYIDGIEEAFQYLRSIDQNNREDILDNILDISVSDY